MVTKALSTNPIIPGEELQGWSSWQPGELGGDSEGEGFTATQIAGLEALRQHLEKGAQPAATMPVGEADPAGEQHTAVDETAVGESVGYPTAAELEAIHQEAWQTGYDEGYQAGLAEGASTGAQQARDEALARFTEIWAPLQALSGGFAQELAHLEEQLSGAVLKLALNLAEKLTLSHIDASEQALTAVLQKVLGDLPSHLSQARLRVNPADLAAAREFLAQETPETQWQWIEDPAIQRGGCIIDTASLKLDLTLQSRLNALYEALGAADKHEPDH